MDYLAGRSTGSELVEQTVRYADLIDFRSSTAQGSRHNQYVAEVLQVFPLIYQLNLDTLF